MATQNPQILQPRSLDSGWAEIDTSPPFESVKEAANLFGGMGFWKPVSYKLSQLASKHGIEVVDVVNLEEQTAQLERELIVKERETLDVLKELEVTKNVIEELKLKLQKEASEINAALDQEWERREGKRGNHLLPSEAPGFILLELKQAKLNLIKTTIYLADIRATVDAYNKKIDKERASLEKTRLRLSSNTSKISYLERELNQTRQNMGRVKDDGVQGSSNYPKNISQELQKLSSETEQFKKIGEAARAQVQRALSEIEQSKAGIRTAEIRLIAAKKMKEAARASEAVALTEMKSLSSTNNQSEDVILTFEEYCFLINKAQEADEACKNRVANTMVLVDEAHVSRTEILKKVEEATEELKVSKQALEEALSRVETANQGKLAVEEALHMWRSEHSHKRRSVVHSSTKFKNPSLQRKDSSLLDVNSASLAGDELKHVQKPTLSIGQILSRKLLTEEYENGMQAADKIMGKRKVSLRQMLSKPSSARKSGKENKKVHAKRKKFGFARISHLISKQSKKKKSSCTCRHA